MIDIAMKKNLPVSVHIVADAHNEWLGGKEQQDYTQHERVLIVGVFEIHSGVLGWETRTEETNARGCAKEMDTEPRSASSVNTTTGVLGVVVTGRSGTSG